MTFLGGVGIVAACVGTALVLRWVWINTPVFPCPECGSYGVHEDDDDEKVHYCICGHSWREE